MIIELKERGRAVSVQRSFPVSYRGQLIGNLIPDLIVDDTVIVDPKVVSCFTETHVAQMIGYLNITSLDLALLIILRMHGWNGNACCASRSSKTTFPTCMAESSNSCYPCNPWFLVVVDG